MGTEPESRESSKEMVTLAQELTRRTQFAADRIKEGHQLDFMNVEMPALNWLITSARSLAGSVLSQADPND